MLFRLGSEFEIKICSSSSVWLLASVTTNDYVVQLSMYIGFHNFCILSCFYFSIFFFFKYNFHFRLHCLLYALSRNLT